MGRRSASPGSSDGLHWRERQRLQQERRRAVHAELRAILDEQLGPQPFPSLIYRPGSNLRNEVFSTSPPVEIILGAAGLACFLPLALDEFTGRQEPILLVIIVLTVAGSLALLVRGLIRIRWWTRARRIAKKWCVENNHFMPHDLRW